MKVYLTPTFMQSLIGFNNTDYRNVTQTIEKFRADPKLPGLSYHRLEFEGCDASFHSIRVNQDLRTIVSQQGDSYYILYTGRHDDAYSWARGKSLSRFNQNEMYLYDECEFQDNLEKFRQTDYNGKKGLLTSHEITAKDLQKLGISKPHAEILVRIADEDDLLAYIEVFPSDISEAIIDLSCGARNITEVYNELHAEETILPSLSFFEVKDDIILSDILREDF